MLSPEHQELLSAHFDGELADEERTRAEELLNESQEARELLQDFDEISAAVRNAYPPHAPHTLRDAVLQRISPPAPQPQPRHAAWPRWLAPALAASLALLVAVLIQTRQTPEPAGENALADAALPTRSPEALEFAAPAPEAAPTSTPAFATRGADTAVEDRMSTAEAAPAGTSAPPARDLSRRLFPNGSLPVPGETRSLLGQQGDVPVLVNYTVVDVEKAAGRMRVLLTNNGIRGLTPPRAARTAPSRANGAADDDAYREGRLLALYVEAPQEQIVAALNDFDAIQEVVDVDADYAEVCTNLGVEADALPFRMQQKWLATRARMAPSAQPLPVVPLAASTEIAPGDNMAADTESAGIASSDTVRLPGDQRPDVPPVAPQPVRPLGRGASGGSMKTTRRAPAARTKPLQRPDSDIKPLLQETTPAQQKSQQQTGLALQIQVDRDEVQELIQRRSRQQARTESFSPAATTFPLQTQPPAPPEPMPLDSDTSGQQQGLSSRRVKFLLILQGPSD